MALHLLFYKEDDTPWGFRLTGGVDCCVPLTVIKVAEGGIAENAGLKDGDLVIKINDTFTTELTHSEVHDVLLAAGQKFYMTVQRGNIFETALDDEQNNKEVSNIFEGSTKESDTSTQEYSLYEEENRTKIDITSDTSDGQTAEVTSSEVEVLPEHNILGSNSNNLDLSQSAVLEVINEKLTETKSDLQPEKKWSTFLQKPQTPKVFPKKKEPEGPSVPPYRVIIKKPNKNKNCANEIEKVLEPSTFSVESYQTVDDFEDESNSKFVNISNSTPKPDNESDEETYERSTYNDDDDSDEDDGDRQNEPDQCLNENYQETEPQLSLEEQLAEVQQQLQALAQVPSSIQGTLDAVTQQLAKIVGASHRMIDEETAIEGSVTSDDEATKQLSKELEGWEEAYEDLKIIEEEDQINSEISHLHETSDSETNEDNQFDKNMQVISGYELASDFDQQMTEEEQRIQQLETEKALQQERMEEFHQRRLEQRPTHPLTPLQRPIILPGGRKWSQPGDALPTPKKQKMPDEKICATIETYSEIITGHTKGLTIGMFCGRGQIILNQFTGPKEKWVNRNLNMVKCTPMTLYYTNTLQ